MSAARVVEIDGLGYTYGSGASARAALAQVTLSVEKGEIFGVLGPNGGGKTTLFGVLSTLLGRFSGAARIAGHDLRSEPAAVRARLGVAFQSPSLDRILTVEENLRHRGHLYRLRGAALGRRIGDALARFRLEEHRRDRVEVLSGGMRRRVELAGALLHAPELLLLDEPSTGLDPGARRDLWHYLELMRREDATTVLLTTHLMEEAARCDRLALLDRGRIVALGSPAELTGEIGGDVITVQCDGAEALAGDIRSTLGAPAVLVDGHIRIESAKGHQFIPRLVEAFPGRIHAVTLAKPSLEDVFIRRTGHSLWTRAAEGQ
jgi:ABC-2 type transport system ATP-binding protein